LIQDKANLALDKAKDEARRLASQIRKKPVFDTLEPYRPVANLPVQRYEDSGEDTPYAGVVTEGAVQSQLPRDAATKAGRRSLAEARRNEKLNRKSINKPANLAADHEVLSKVRIAGSAPAIPDGNVIGDSEIESFGKKMPTSADTSL